MFSSLYKVGAVKRTIIIWFLLQGVLWAFFADIGNLAKPSAWDNVQRWPRQAQRLAELQPTIAGTSLQRNAVVMLFIGGGNLFVRFGSVTPRPAGAPRAGGAIGWLAGTNWL